MEINKINNNRGFRFSGVFGWISLRRGERWRVWGEQTSFNQNSPDLMLRVIFRNISQKNMTAQWLLGRTGGWFTIKISEGEELLTMTGKSTFPTCLTISNIWTIWNLNFSSNKKLRHPKNQTELGTCKVEQEKQNFICFVPIKLGNFISLVENFPSLVFMTKRRFQFMTFNSTHKKQKFFFSLHFYDTCRPLTLLSFP